jgi:hypothetical protein
LDIFTAIVEQFHNIGIDTYRRLESFDESTAFISELANRTIRLALSDARERDWVRGYR